MKVKCEYCDAFIDDTADFCPNCGAVNNNVMRSGNGIPKTMEQLKAFCAEKGMDLPKMRFFIDEDYRQPRAFGIYKDGENFVVYKNKDDGSRAIRYRGTDEAYAVNEIYQKLWSEVQTRRARDIANSNVGERGNNNSDTSANKGCLGKGCFGWLFSKGLGLLIVIVVICIGTCATWNKPNNGYYRYNNHDYYFQNDVWYMFNNAANSWFATDVDSSLYENYRDYYNSSSYSSDYDSTDFSESEYYSPSSSSWDSDWDSDSWDYDYGGWDSGGSDWSSDW